MEKYLVTGMTCAACQARVEKAVSQLEGVSSCSVSLLTNSMSVEGSVDPQGVIKAVEEAGYGASLKDEADNKGTASYSEKLRAEEEALKDKTTPLLRKRLIYSVIFLLILMYFSMGHGMFGLPVPPFFEGNHIALGLVELLLSAIVMVINQRFFISGFKSLAHRAPNMDSLIALGSAAAFIYSVVMLFAMTDAGVKGNEEMMAHYSHEFYFEAAAMILTLITVGKMLESYSKGRTTDALKSLMELAPQTANILRDGREISVSVDEVKKGDIFLVRPGESIPVDGTVLEGESAVNEAALTGESIPVDKAAGDTVSSATINSSGFLKCEASRVGEDTTLSQIIKMVSDAAATKAPVQKLADRISGIFVPAVIIIALLTFVLWLLAGETVGFSLARGICVLVVSCPCALGLATPVSIMVGSGVGARNGILFKNAEALQETGNIRIAALDKTGTITNGEPEVTDVIPADGVSEDELLKLAYSLEIKSEHPLSKAVTAYASEKGTEPEELNDFKAHAGNGLSGKIKGNEAAGGNLRFISAKAEISRETEIRLDELSNLGKTPLLFAEGGRFKGIIAVSDTIREDSRKAIEELK
ncbi:MAG: heavy metal translocating P-type ATPase, partial [Lachnospiraceae bacterium]|nr:heavy metal translocating P-type ATPase [Lachnospiraceae bacterium]